MKTTLFIMLMLGLCGCTVTRSKSVNGQAFTTASVLENAESKTVTFDPSSGFVTIAVSQQDQVSGAKAIGAAMATLETIDAGAEYLMRRLGKEQAIETATNPLQPGPKVGEGTEGLKKRFPSSRHPAGGGGVAV
ncbi:MAG: hypothetical protein JNK37_21220 [Verrucomicrobiales bacterium]|nr:hypothetical protein [Verrucomicrobiales bacterium]